MSWTITACIGVSLVAVGLALAAAEHVWLRRAHIGHGTIAELIPTNTGRRAGYAPRVRFRAVDGTEHEFKRSYSTRPAGFVVGERVLVAYNPRTYDGRILTFGQRFGFAVVFVSVGSAMMVMSACFIFGTALVPRIYQQPTTVPIQ